MFKPVIKIKKSIGGAFSFTCAERDILCDKSECLECDLNCVVQKNIYKIQMKSKYCCEVCGTSVDFGYAIIMFMLESLVEMKRHMCCFCYEKEVSNHEETEM